MPYKCQHKNVFILKVVYFSLSSRCKRLFGVSHSLIELPSFVRINSWFSYFSNCCDKTPTKKQSKEQDLGSQSKGAYSPSWQKVQAVAVETANSTVYAFWKKRTINACAQFTISFFIQPKIPGNGAMHSQQVFLPQSTYSR